MKSTLIVVLFSLALVNGILADTTPAVPTTIAPSTAVKFTSSVAKIVKDKAFIATCEIINPKEGSLYYQVEFKQTKESLGTFTYDKHDKDYASVKFEGSRVETNFPVSNTQFNETEHKFWMTITEKSVNLSDEYWCTFKTNPTDKPIESNKFKSNASFANIPSVIFVAFTTLISLRYSIYA